MNQRHYTQGPEEYIDTRIRRLLERHLASEARPPLSATGVGNPTPPATPDALKEA